jgi:hypothetical protein
MLLIIGIILAVIGAALLFVVAWAGLPVVLIGAVLVVLHITASRRSGGPKAGTIESGRTEPTGQVRTARGGAQTANERVGQE